MNPDMSVWTGRDDTPTEGPNALRWWQCVKPYTPDAEPGIVLIGFACDEGVRRNGGRVGAKDGPRALRKALANMAWHIRQPVYDLGDIQCTDGNLELAQDELGNGVAAIIAKGHRPIVLGGGHEASWGTFCGYRPTRRKERVGIINLDAHLDLRDSPVCNSGTPFLQIASWCNKNDRRFQYCCVGMSHDANTSALLNRANQLGTVEVFDLALCLEDRSESLLQVKQFMDTSDEIHLSIDLDVLQAAIMPAVSAPAPFGVTLATVETIARIVLASKPVVAVDIVELNPTYDVGNAGAKVAAHIANQIAMYWHQ